MDELTYGDYLRLDELLALQRQKKPDDPDELLFIVVHQAYELWFKQLLHELERIRAGLFAGDLWLSISLLKRCRTIMKVLVAQADIVETLTPLGFSGFRDRLEHASGFQSSQFRELEFLLGNKRPEMLRFHPAGTPAHDRMSRRLGEPTLGDAFTAFVAKADTGSQAGESFQDALVRLYKTRPDLVILFELMADFDEGLQEWRYRHVKLAERTIGAKPGTGGSTGVEFLKKSLFKPLFPDLWAIRQRL
ncbi:MAG: hypothetical protein K2W96_26085 [Gemmataceae bacterium]|nr:hypothetical protein [Gemmataceae bacterium]